MEFKNIKQVMRALKTDVPKLLGYQKCNVCMLDAQEKALWTVNLNEDTEKRAHEANGGTFEYDFTFTADQVIKFPTSMGVNGFVFTADAVAYKNDCSKIFGHRKAYPDLYCCGDIKIPFKYQKDCGKALGYSFNQRVDNFLEVEKIHNVAVCSIQDDEFVKRPFGTLQCYNRINSEITPEDLEKLRHFRKLIGGTLKKCEYWAITLQIVLGLQSKANQLEKSTETVDNLVTTRDEVGITTLQLMVASVQDTFQKFDFNQ